MYLVVVLSGQSAVIPSRRHWIAQAAGLVAATTSARIAGAHSGAGRVLPAQPAPAFSVTTHQGQRSTLPKLLSGRATGLQLMFTGCRSTCPMQGALFSAVAQNLPASAPVQLVSVTIDPLNDDAPVLRRWLKAFDAPTHWLAVTPEHRDVDRLLEFLKVRASANDRHTAQVYYFNTDGALVLRSTDYPVPKEVARSLLLLSSLS